MDDQLNFQTYLFLGPKDIKIKIINKNDLDELYFNEATNNDNFNEKNFDFIDFFLEKNIFQVERKVNKFIKSANLIVDSNEFLTIYLSIKKENYGELLKKKDLSHLLNEAKYECRKTINLRRITHMIIDNYYIDNKSYSSFPENLKCNFFTIDIKFICLSESFIEKVENILKKYQITVKHILSSDYVKSFINDKEEDIFKMSMKLIEGFNENEVSIVPKISNNKGFFERFFNFFN
jgi:galactitol-specific phosphotransferase system IIB component